MDMLLLIIINESFPFYIELMFSVKVELKKVVDGNLASAYGLTGTILVIS